MNVQEYIAAEFPKEYIEQDELTNEYLDYANAIRPDISNTMLIICLASALKSKQQIQINDHILSRALSKDSICYCAWCRSTEEGLI